MLGLSLISLGNASVTPYRSYFASLTAAGCRAGSWPHHGIELGWRHFVLAEVVRRFAGNSQIPIIG
jgi:hypothetical protein